jgi:hypothetical protein
MGILVPDSIIDKVARGEPLTDYEVAFIRSVRQANRNMAASSLRLITLGLGAGIFYAALLAFLG